MERGPAMEVHDVIGSFGPWQAWVLAAFFYINVVAMWQNMAVTFLAPNVPFRCVEPSSGDWLNRSGHQEHYYDSSCKSPLPDADGNVTWVDCTGFEYEKSVFPDTIVSEWDLVCDREWLISLAKSVYMIGFLFSVIVFGQISDCYGRFPAIVLTYAITCGSCLLSLVSNSYVMFAVIRFFQAFGSTGLITVGFVLIMEIFGPEHRTGAVIVYQLSWALGFSSVALVGWLLPHWFWFQVALCVPFIPLAFALIKIPESPRILLTQGKMEKLEKLIVTASRMNKRKIIGDVKDLEIFKTKKDEKDKNSKTLFDLLKIPAMRNRTFIMVVIWMVNSFTYYGLAYNTNDLAGNMYLNCLISGLVEFISYALLYTGIRWWGRRPTLLALMLGVGVSCAAIPLTPKSGSPYAWTGTALAMVGKCCVRASFSHLYIYTTELYPTVVRNVALGTCSMCSRVGSIVSPFVRELGHATHPSVPDIMYGVLCIGSGLLTFAYVPETSGNELKDRLEESELYERPIDKNGKITTEASQQCALESSQL